MVLTYACDHSPAYAVAFHILSPYLVTLSLSKGRNYGCPLDELGVTIFLKLRSAVRWLRR